MNYFACVTFGLKEMLFMLGIAVLIAAAAAYLIAVVMSLIFSAPVQTMLGAEAIALLLCAGVVGALGSEMGGIVFLTLLGVSACLIILAMNWLFRLITGGRKEPEVFSLLGLNEQPDFDTVE